MSAAGVTDARALPAGALVLLALGLLALAAYRLFALWLADLPLYFDEAQYWGWSRELAWGYYSKPPMIAVAILAATSLCGDGETCVRSVGTAGYLLAAAFVYLAVARLHGARAAAWASVVFATLPLASFGSWAATTDAPLMLFWSAALYGFVRALESDRLGWWLAAGACGGLGLLSKYTMGVFAVSVLVYLLWEPAQRGRLRSWKPWAAAALAFALILPNLWWNARLGFPTFTHVAELSQLERAWLQPAEFAQTVLGQLVVFGPIAGAVLFVVLYGWARGRADPRLRLWIAFTVPMLAIVSLQALLARANLNWGAPAAVAGSAWIALVLLEAGRTRLLAASIGLNLSLAVALYHLAPATQALGLPPKWDATARLKGWPEAGVAVRDTLARHPGARLVGYERIVIAELIYYARPYSAGVRVWNPQRRITDHYRLVADVADSPQGPFIIAMRSESGAALARDFRNLRPLGVIEGGDCEGCRRTLHLYHAASFEGYRP